MTDILTLLDDAASKVIDLDKGWCITGDYFEACSPKRIRALVACVRTADRWFGLDPAGNPDVEAAYHAARAKLDETL